MWLLKNAYSLFEKPKYVPIDGMRSISCLMIISAHIISLLNLLIPSYPHEHWMAYLKSYSYRLMPLLTLSLETFFMLSGFLLTLKFIRQRHFFSLKSYPMYILRRACRWNNSIGVLWSISLDMQVHILLPLVLHFITKFNSNYQKPYLALYILIIPCIVYSLLVFNPKTMDLVTLLSRYNLVGLLMSEQNIDLIKDRYNVTMGFEKSDDRSLVVPFMELVYLPLQSRYSSFVIGSILAFYLTDVKNKSMIRYSTIKKYIYFSLTLLLMILLTTPNEPDHVNTTVLSIIVSITKQLFSISQAFILFSSICPLTHPYHSPWMKSFLSLPIWTPIANLSYLIYVIHFRIAFEFIMSQNHLFDSKRYSIDVLTPLCLLIVLTACLILSAIWSILVEQPFQRWVLKRLCNNGKSHQK